MNKIKSEDNNLLQIQPVHSFRDKWLEVAERESLGFEVLELSAPPALNESGLYNNCLEWYRETGRSTSVHGCFIDVNPASGDKKFRELSKDRCRESCKVAKELGAGNVVFHSSCFPFLRGPYLEGWAALSAEFYEELADEYDLNLYIENSPDIDPGPLKALMETIKTDKIGVCLDIGHAAYSGTPVETWFEELHDYIGYLHLSDNMGQYDDHLPLGKGSIDWAETDRLYKSLGKKIPITLEVGNIDNVKASIEFLKENRFFGMSR